MLATLEANNDIKIIKGDDRIAFLPKYFNSLCLEVERYVFALAEKQIEGYSGGFWEFGLTTNNNPIMIPSVKRDSIKISNFYGGEPVQLSLPLVGIVLTGGALCMCLEKYGQSLSDVDSDRFVDMYHSLLGDGYQLAEEQGYQREFFHLVD